MSSLIFCLVSPEVLIPLTLYCLAASHTHFAVLRHTIFISSHTLGPIFPSFQDRSKAGSDSSLANKKQHYMLQCS